jgi:hypothetical protein
MPMCKSGNHNWLFQEDADKCCNGFRRVLMIGNIKGCDRIGRESLPNNIKYGYKWEKI